jgi:hypothetical protein
MYKIYSKNFHLQNPQICILRYERDFIGANLNYKEVKKLIVYMKGWGDSFLKISFN